MVHTKQDKLFSGLLAPANIVDLDRLAAGLQVLGSLDPQALPLHHAQVFVFVATQGRSVKYKEIEDHFGITNASVSRTINSLGETSGHRKQPLGLVVSYPDPEDGRRLRVRLTKKGEQLLRTLQSL